MPHTPGPWHFNGNEIVANSNPRMGIGGFVTNDSDCILAAAAPDLLEASEKALKFIEAIMGFYGQNLQVFNWHMNGDAEPWDNFFDEKMDGNELDLLRNAIQKAKNEK